MRKEKLILRLKSSYIYIGFSGEKRPNIYCVLTLFTHGLTEERRRERSSMAVLGSRKLPSQIGIEKGRRSRN